ncbi:tail length tape measure protein [Geobacillus phage TP-84]|uniref:Tail length tape-measure protein n=1 Tax=Geobacillus phage TP-84 TaxID=1965361 RepID=A0A1U9WQS5_9CAUD|nr:tail length tape measure protein [Geobacillus phage TP-84]AQY55119.1 tail length tape measure protein [Geobacillus phage TP-84]
MATIRELRAKFTATANGFKSAIQGIKKDIQSLNDASNKAADNMNSRFSNLKSTLVGFAGAYLGFEALKGGITSVATAMIQGNANMEQYHATLTTVLKSSEKATEMLAWAEKFAASTPFEIPDIVEATTKLEVYGISAKETLKDIGDMAAITGKPLMQAVEAIADAQTGELERLKEFGITKQMLIDKAQELYGKEIVNAKGQITDMETMNKALFAIMRERYSGGMEYISKTFNGMLANIKDSMGTIAAELGKPIFEKLKGQMEDLVPIMSAFTSFIRGDMSGAMKTLTEAFGANKAQQIMSFFQTIKNAGMGIKDFFVSLAPTVQNIGTILGNIAPIIIGPLVIAFKAIAAVLPPVLNTITGIVAKFTEWEGFIPLVTGLAAAMAVFKAQTVATQIVTTVATRATQMWAAAQRLLNLAMSMNPMTLIIGLIVGLVAALVMAYQRSETFRNIVNNAWQSIKSVVSAVINWFVTTIPQWVENVKNWFVGLGQRISETWSNIKNGIVSIWQNIIGTVVPIVQSFVQAIVERAKQIATNVMNFIRPLIDFFKNTWNNIKLLVLSIVGVFLNLLVGNFEGLKISLLGIWTAIKNQVINIATTIKSMAVNIFTALKNGVLAVINGLKSLAISAWNGLKSAAISVWTGLKNGVVNTVQALKNTAINIVNSVKSGVVNAFNSAKNLAISAWNALKSGVSNAINSVKSLVSNMKNNIISTIKGINLFEMGKNVIQGFIKGIKSMVGAVGKAIKEVASNVTNKIKSALGIHSPSRVLMEIGAYTGQGFAIGIENMKKAVVNATQSLADATIGTISSAELNPTEPQVAVAAATGAQTNYNAPLMYVENQYVNDNTDVRDISHGLYNLQRRSDRKKGW